MVLLYSHNGALLCYCRKERPPINSFDAVIHMQEGPPHKRFLVGRSPSFYATRGTPHGAPRLVLAMFTWWVKTRRAPPGSSRDSRVYDHTTTACRPCMKNSTPPVREAGTVGVVGARQKSFEWLFGTATDSTRKCTSNYGKSSVGNVDNTQQYML